MNNRTLVLFAFVLAIVAAFADRTMVALDESGVIHPEGARIAISNACSAVVAVNIAEAKADVLTNTVDIANRTIAEANELLTKFADYCIIDLYATGMTIAETNQASVGEIDIVACSVDRVSDPSNILVSLTWQYVQGSFNTPEILVATSLTNATAFATCAMTTPEQIAWGQTVAYTSTASVPKATFSSRAFFKIKARLNTPIDDGRVFDIYSEEGGITSPIIFRPGNTYKITFTAGRVTQVELVQ